MTDNYTKEMLRRFDLALTPLIDRIYEDGFQDGHDDALADTMDTDDLAALTAILDYMWKDEEKSYEESPDDSHVFNHLVTLRAFVDNHKNNL